MKMMDDLDAVGERFSLGRDEIIKVIQNISNTARNNAISGKDLKRSADDSIKALKCCLPPADKNMAKTKAALLKEIPRFRKASADQNDATISTQSCLTSIDAFLYFLNHHDTIPWAYWGALSSINCGAKSKKAGVFDEVEKLMSAHLHFPEFQNDLFNYIKLCFDAADRSMEAYEKTKQKQGLLDFADQEAMLLKALEIPSVQKRFKEQFKVLMVDEFQDTSPLQLSLFLKISALVEKVIWVGDSKQAIYGFRGSDAQLITTVTAALDKPGSNEYLTHLTGQRLTWSR